MCRGDKLVFLVSRTRWQLKYSLLPGVGELTKETDLIELNLKKNAWRYIPKNLERFFGC